MIALEHVRRALSSRPARRCSPRDTRALLALALSFADRRSAASARDAGVLLHRVIEARCRRRGVRRSVHRCTRRACTFTGPMSLSRCGRSPRLIACETTLAPSRLHEAQAPAADRRNLDPDTFRLPILDPGEREAQGVGVEPAAQALVRRDEDQPDVLDLRPLEQERMPVLGVGASEVTRDRRASDRRMDARRACGPAPSSSSRRRPSPLPW